VYIGIDIYNKERERSCILESIYIIRKGNGRVSTVPFPYYIYRYQYTRPFPFLIIYIDTNIHDRSISLLYISIPIYTTVPFPYYIYRYQYTRPFPFLIIYIDTNIHDRSRKGTVVYIGIDISSTIFRSDNIIFPTLWYFFVHHFTTNFVI
jgi:hypothetical protein